MFVGYNLKLTKEDFQNVNYTYEYYLERGRVLYKLQKEQCKTKMLEFTRQSGRIDGSRLQENWFPIVKADIFLSHSHRDEELAITLAGYLYEEYDLKVFIDSCFWGYSNDLLKAIDDEYCKNDNSNTYCYDRRNHSTSHIHMMLSNALQRMIDETECLIFLNTDNSITSVPDEIKEKTLSPWIFMELETSKIARIVKRREITYYEEKSLNATFSINESTLLIEYDIDINHLFPLNPVILLKLRSRPNLCGLDLLYSQTLSPIDFYEIDSKSMKI